MCQVEWLAFVEILQSFALSDANKKKYAPVVAQFEAHFVKRRTIIFEYAHFNMHVLLACVCLLDASLTNQVIAL